MPRDPRVTSKGFHPNIASIPFEQFERDGWELEIECFSCHRVTYEPKPAERFGSHASTGTVFKRLVCECGAGLPSMRAVVR